MRYFGAPHDGGQVSVADLMAVWRAHPGWPVLSFRIEPADDPSWDSIRWEFARYGIKLAADDGPDADGLLPVTACPDPRTAIRDRLPAIGDVLCAAGPSGWAIYERIRDGQVRRFAVCRDPERIGTARAVGEVVRLTGESRPGETWMLVDAW